MSKTLPNTEKLTALVDSLESHEGPMTERERQLCTTLLHGLAAAGQLVLTPPVVPAEGLTEYDYEQASETERWAYDQGYEAGWDARLNPDGLHCRLVGPVSFSEYSKGLRHGHEDCGQAVRDILDSDDSDERKIERLRWLVAAPLTYPEQQP